MNALAIFTNRIASCSDQTGQLLQQQAIKRLRATTDLADADRYVFYWDNIRLSDAWDNDLYNKFLQSGTCFGSRLGTAFERLFQQRYQQVSMIGLNRFPVTNALLDDTFSLLRMHDVVVGPAADGRLYLLACSRYIPELFSLESWGTTESYPEVVKRLEELQLRWHALPALRDQPEGVFDIPPLVSW